jgi:hypothetical protein
MKTNQDYIKELDKRFPKILGKHKVKAFPREAFYDLRILFTQALNERTEEIEKETKLRYRKAIMDLSLLHTLDIARVEEYMEALKQEVQK